jgi:polyhydroxyalkanoate synthesis regulator phasin
VAEPLQNYVSLVSGLTRGSRERVAKLAEEILNASRANRELMENLVVAEVDRAAARLGFARADDVQALRDEVADLRASVAALQAKQTAARKTAAKKAPAKKTAAQNPAAENPAAENTAAGSPAE